MKNKMILEQEKLPVLDLGQAYKSGCFTTYKWFTIDTGLQPKKTKSGKSVISGKNNKGEQIFFYENGKVKNLVTGKELNWSCDKLAGQTSGVLSKFGVTKDDEQKVTDITKVLEGYAAQGAVSNVFSEWNKMLNVNFPKLTKLTKTAELPVDLSDLKTNYQKVQGLDRQFGWNNVDIYLPIAKTDTVTVQGKTDLDVTDCRTKLTNYVVSAIQANAGITPSIDMTQVLKYQTELQRCWANNAYADFSGITETDVAKLTKELSPFGFFKMGKKLSFNNIKKILKGETKYLKPKNAYSYIFTIDRAGQKESKLDNLDLLIKENLMNSLEKKKKTTLTENTIIVNRTNILLEGGIPKTKEGQERLIDEIINEAISLNAQGLDKDLINESFWDTIKGLFGNYAGGGLVEMFKEKFMRYLIGKLTPADPDGWTAGVIEKAFGNIPVADYFNGKILQCDYLTHVLTKSLVEEVIAKAGQSSMGSKIGGESIVFDVLRNSIVNQLDDTDFAKNIEHGLAKFVCPAIQGISGKMDKAVDQMRDKALKP